MFLENFLDPENELQIRFNLLIILALLKKIFRLVANNSARL